MLLVKYGEIALKSKSVRRRFEQQLMQNIRDGLSSRRLEAAIEAGRGVITIRTSSTGEVEEILSRTFGVIYYSRMTETPSTIPEMEAQAAISSNDFPDGTSFAVRCKRTGDHPFTSMELAATLGSSVMKAHHNNMKVDLESPVNTLWVEVRNNKCHMYTKRNKGPGGMPVGTQGRALLVVKKNHEEDSAMAGWMVLKRGVSLRILLEEGAEDITQMLEPWGGPKTPLCGASLEDAARETRSLAIVVGDRMPEEKPQVPPPMAFLYPLASLETTFIQDIRKTLINA